MTPRWQSCMIRADSTLADARFGSDFPQFTRLRHETAIVSIEAARTSVVSRDAMQFLVQRTLGGLVTFANNAGFFEQCVGARTSIACVANRVCGTAAMITRLLPGVACEI